VDDISVEDNDIRDSIGSIPFKSLVDELRIINRH